MTTKADQLVGRILESIEAGEYDIGERLPTYSEMEKWGTWQSRSPRPSAG